MSLDVKQIQKLREETSASMQDVKRALEETDGDEAKALEILRERGKAIAEKKSSREAKDGLVFSYVHQNGKIGVLLELNCETDFVAKTEEFQNLGKDLCMHITAMSPETVDGEEETALMKQQFIKNPEKTVAEVITEVVAKVGENVTVGDFTRYEI